MDAIVIPNVTLTVDQLLLALRQLDKPTRLRVAQALLNDDLDARFGELLQRLSAGPVADDISDQDIQAEINAVRAERRRDREGIPPR